MEITGFCLHSSFCSIMRKFGWGAGGVHCLGMVEDIGGGFSGKGGIRISELDDLKANSEIVDIVR